MSATSSAAPEVAEPAGSQAVKAQLRLREMILAGELAGGARIAEWRSPSCSASRARRCAARSCGCEQEGLLEALPNGGYAVRTFSERDVSDAIELRGTLEGLAARLAAERGAPPVVLREARACLAAHRRTAARAGARRRGLLALCGASTSSSTRCWPRCPAAR